MLRTALGVLFASAFGLGVLACHQAQQEFCLSDFDCPDDARCVQEKGIKACRPIRLGGSGGAGGAAGGGGSSGGPGLEAELQLRLVPDSELGAFLENHPRRVGAMRFIYRLASEMPEETVELRFPESQPLPLDSLTIQLPMVEEAAELRARIQLDGYRMDASLAVFASGQVFTGISALEPDELTIEVSLDLEFDWDLDGDPDASDCAPENPERHQNNPEICDGVAEGCTPYCYLPIPSDEPILDLDCSVSHRQCAVVIGNEPVYCFEADAGVRVFHGDHPWIGRDLEEIGDACAIRWDEESGLLVVARSFHVQVVDRGGKSIGAAYTSGGPNVSVTEQEGWALSVGVAENYVSVVKVDGISEGEYSTCNPDTCGFMITKADLGFLVATKPTPEASLKVYAIKTEGWDEAKRITPELYFTAVDLETLKRDYPTSGVLPAIDGVTVPHFLEISGAGVIAIGGEGAEDAKGAWTRIRDTASAHEPPEPFELPPGVCPSALTKVRGKDLLLLGDECSGSFWEIPIDSEGKPLGENHVQRPLGRCEKPVRLAYVPETEEQASAVFVACEGEQHILVYGRY